MKQPGHKAVKTQLSALDCTEWQESSSFWHFSASRLPQPSDRPTCQLFRQRTHRTSGQTFTAVLILTAGGLIGTFTRLTAPSRPEEANTLSSIETRNMSKGQIWASGAQNPSQHLKRLLESEKRTNESSCCQIPPLNSPKNTSPMISI